MELYPVYDQQHHIYYTTVIDEIWGHHERHSHMYACDGKHCMYYCTEPLTRVGLYIPYTTPSTSQEALQGKSWAGKYSRNLCASKKSSFNVHNCKSGRHNRMRRKVPTLLPTSVHCKEHKIRKQERLTELLDPVLKVKTRTEGEYKVPLPQR